MKKIASIFVLSILLLNISCNSIKNAVNTATNSNPVELKAPSANNPAYIKNAKTDTHASDESSIVVRVDSDDISSIGKGGLFINGGMFAIDRAGEKLEKLLEVTPAERQLIYLDANRNIKISTLIIVIDAIRKQDVENIALVVSPENKRGVSFDVLKVKIMPEPKDETTLTPAELGKRTTELGKRTYINMSKDGKINFARLDTKTFSFIPEKEELKLEELQTKIQEQLGKKAGENDKRIYVRAVKSRSYDLLAKMIDAAIGAGAEVYLEIDDLVE